MNYRFIPHANLLHTEPQSLTGRLALFDFLRHPVQSKPQTLTGQLAPFDLEIWEKTSTSIVSSPSSFI